MANQYPNKIIFGNGTILDLTQDTVDPSHLLLGYTAHDASGAIITGTYDGSSTTVSSIEITKLPDKVEFTIYEETDYSGIEVIAHTADGFDKDITNEVTYNPAEGIIISTEGSKTVTVSYRGVTATFLIMITAGEYIPPSWANGTDEDIQYALTKHYNGDIDIHDYWSVDDTRIIQMSPIENPNGTTIPAQSLELKLVNVGGRTLTTPINNISTCAFAVQIVANGLNYYPIDIYTSDTIDWKTKRIRTWCNSTFLNNLPNKTIFKEFVNPYRLNNSAQQVDDYIALLQGSDTEGTSKFSYYTPSNTPAYDKHFESRDSTGSNGWVLVWSGTGSKVDYRYVYPNTSTLDRVVLFGVI